MSSSDTQPGVKAGIPARLKRRWNAAQHRRQLRRAVRHLSGPTEGQAAPGEATLVCLVRDGVYYIDAFLAHYRSLGIRHFVFIDNGSQDGTPERLASEPGVAVLQALLPWGAFENGLRNYAAKRYCRERWCLFADMDEIFEAPGASGMAELLARLEREGATALTAQMLEMVPEGPFAAAERLSYAEVLETFRFCSTADISRVPYTSAGSGLDWFLQQNSLPACPPDILSGGLRRSIFGEDCCLTKHPLVFAGEGVEPGVHPHVSTGVRVASFDALIRHYKFANSPLVRDRRSIAEGSVPHGEDALRARRMAAEPDLSLCPPEARLFPGVAALQDEGFLRRGPE